MTNLNITQSALMVVYTPGAGGNHAVKATQTAVKAPYSPPLAKGYNASQLAAIVAYAPPRSRDVVSAQLAALVPYSPPKAATPDISQLAIMAAWGSYVATETRTRAWTFTLDGHTFYVLDLGQEGTFAYDFISGQWANFQTDSYVGWNMRNGTMFDNNSRTAGADNQSGFIWELDPDQLLDEAFRDILHTVTGGIATRNRVFLSCDALRLTLSAGTLTDSSGADISMRFSDDQGKTWSAPYTITMQELVYNQDIAFTSLGSFMAPGRIFEISDSGGPVRIDGADVFIDGFDGQPGGG